jgi:hypothetical protein
MRLRRLIRRRTLPRQKLKPSLNGPMVIRRKRGHLLPGGYRQIRTLQALSEGRRTEPLPNLALGMRAVPLLNRPRQPYRPSLSHEHQAGFPRRQCGNSEVPKPDSAGGLLGKTDSTDSMLSRLRFCQAPIQKDVVSDEQNGQRGNISITTSAGEIINCGRTEIQLVGVNYDSAYVVLSTPKI